jgi:response regulator RpfG family c-di-GMP phosphodiesterase
MRREPRGAKADRMPKKKKILFVDDDADTQDIVSFILDDEAIELLNLGAVPPTAAIAEVEPDLILLDEWLPEKKGSEFCLELKSKKHTAHIPVILISAVVSLETIARNCRADGFIHKPFDIEQLKQVVSACLATV